MDALMWQKIDINNMLQFAWFLMSGKSDNCYKITIALNLLDLLMQSKKDISSVLQYACFLMSGKIDNNIKNNNIVILLLLSFFPDNKKHSN